MNSIEQYRKRFFNLMESTMGNVKPLILEQETPPITASEISVYGPKDREVKVSIKTGGEGFFDVKVTNESLFKIINVFEGGQSDKKFNLGQNPSTDKNLNAINVTYIKRNLKKGDSITIFLQPNQDFMGENRITKSVTAPFDGINGFIITFSNINYGEYDIYSLVNGTYDQNRVYFTITNPNPEPEPKPEAKETPSDPKYIEAGYQKVSEINLPDGTYIGNPDPEYSSESSKENLRHVADLYIYDSAKKITGYVISLRSPSRSGEENKEVLITNKQADVAGDYYFKDKGYKP